MSQLTTNSSAFIEATQYYDFIVENLPAFSLPPGLWRDVSDFSVGTTLNIKTIGAVTIQDAAEDVPLVANPIDTNTITLTVTDYVGDAWSISDDLRRDGSQIDKLMANRGMESTKALGVHHETRFLAVAASESGTGQTAANVNLVNGQPHRWVAGGAGGTNRVMTIADFIAMKFSFDKANVPAGGRVCFVDPVVEATINSLTNLVNVSNNPHFEGVITSGFERNHKFIKNIYGWDIWTTNYLPTKTATEALDPTASNANLANDTAEIGDVACVFMSVADDNTKPVMHAWRVMPSVEGWRDSPNRGDNFQTTSRFALGMQRTDTVGVVWVTPSDY
jgi:hypothetical protein